MPSGEEDSPVRFNTARKKKAKPPIWRHQPNFKTPKPTKQSQPSFKTAPPLTRPPSSSTKRIWSPGDPFTAASQNQTRDEIRQLDRDLGSAILSSSVLCCPESWPHFASVCHLRFIYHIRHTNLTHKFQYQNILKLSGNHNVENLGKFQEAGTYCRHKQRSTKRKPQLYMYFGPIFTPQGRSKNE